MDAPSISSLLYESFLEYKSSYTEKGFTATTPPSDQILDRLKEGPTWVALQEETIVGTVSAVSKEDSLYIRGMAILPSARGQRIGERLLKQIEDYASEHAFRILLLSTTPFLSRAIRLYEHYGFKRSDEGPNHLFGTPLFSMRKVIGSLDRKRSG